MLFESNVIGYVGTDERYQNITHQWDVWHTDKNLGKKLLAVSK